jgi:pyruvate dehydrogenase E2 component (dihydrolipoamide acetyltransferase)
MPKWGLTMTEGKVTGWLKQQGDAVRAGDELCEIETSKITNVFEAPEAGTLRRVVAAEGATLPIGALLAIVAPDSVGETEIENFVAAFAVPEPETAEEADEAAAPRDIDAGGRRLRVLDIGGGEAVPVLLIHGFGADLNTWMFTQPVLAETRRAVALDLPGHGGSTKAVGSGDAADFAAVIGDALASLAIERAHLVGHSLGAAIAIAYAARRPDRVASLTLIAPAGMGPDISGTFIDGFIRAQRRREAQEVLALLVHNPALVSRTMVEEILRYKRLDGVQAALETIARMWFPGGRQVVDLGTDLATLSLPVQVIWGRDDRIVPVSHGEALAGRVPVHILDEAGHLPHMEKAGEVNRLIRDFVGPLA